MPCNVSWTKECDGARQFTARRPTLSVIQRLAETTELSFATHQLPFLPDFIWQKRWTEHCGVAMRWEIQVWRWSWWWHSLVRTSEVTRWEKKNHKSNQWVILRRQQERIRVFYISCESTCMLGRCTLTLALWSGQQVWANQRQTGDACSKVCTRVCLWVDLWICSVAGRNWRVIAEQTGPVFFSSAQTHRRQTVCTFNGILLED